MTFSKHLKNYFGGETMAEVIQNVKKSSQNRFQINDHHVVVDSIIQKGEYFTNCELLRSCICKKEYQDVIIWINKNIIANMDKDSDYTTHVKIRIATSMIFKNCKKDDAILMHLALVHNINEVRMELINEDLPF